MAESRGMENLTMEMNQHHHLMEANHQMEKENLGNRTRGVEPKPE